MSYWEDRRRAKENRTQLELGNYSTGCSGSLADAAWLSCLGIKWDIAEDRRRPKAQTRNHDDEVMKQSARTAYDILKEQIRKNGLKVPSAEERKVAEWINSHRLEWVKRFGPDIANRLEAYINRSLAEGKLKYIGKDQRLDILEALEKETEAKIREHESAHTNHYHIGYDQAAGPSKAAYQFVEPDGTRIQAQVVAQIGNWVKLSDGKRPPSWYIVGDNSILPGSPADAATLDKEWRNRQKLGNAPPDSRDWDLPLA